MKLKMCMCVTVNSFYWHVHTAKIAVFSVFVILMTAIAYVNSPAEGVTKMSFLKILGLTVFTSG